VHDFRRALAENPAPTRLGDVRLRYEPSMLIGETEEQGLSWRPGALATVGVIVLVAGLALLAVRTAQVALGPVLAAAALLWGSVWLRRRERGKRGFVVNFTASHLRLDFVTPIAGKPQTLLVRFEDVKAVELMEQGDGQHCLTVDFDDDGALLREVLVAFVGSGELEAAKRLARVLQGAFGLGSVPPDSPYLATLSHEQPAQAGATLEPSKPA
jgi:hypothetical protein